MSEKLNEQRVIDLFENPINLSREACLNIQDAFFDEYEECLYQMIVNVKDGMVCHFLVDAHTPAKQHDAYRGFILGYIAGYKE